MSKNEYYAHSQIKTTSGNPSLNEYSTEPKGKDIIFKATEAPDVNGIPYLRTADTEYKILNDLAKRLGDKVDTKGKIRLFTELDTCGSCNYIIRQFNDKYPNIEIEVIHNNGVFVTPK
ncbi:deaminase domain-containing protein [Aneurinibacillus aneurinilyticus]